LTCLSRTFVRNLFKSFLLIFSGLRAPLDSPVTYWRPSSSGRPRSSTWLGVDSSLIKTDLFFFGACVVSFHMGRKLTRYIFFLKPCISVRRRCELLFFNMLLSFFFCRFDTAVSPFVNRMSPVSAPLLIYNFFSPL